MNGSTLRNADLDQLAALLTDQNARKVDMVVPASKIRSEEGTIRITGADPVIDADGVTDADGYYAPTTVFDEGLADKFGIPLAYLRRMRGSRPDLLDANVNGWLHGVGNRFDADARSFMVRTFKSTDTQAGVARAFLSDRYRRVDNFDVLTAALQGVRDAGVNAQVVGCDLSERRMQVRIAAPEVQALAPTLLRGYRSPFTGEQGSDNPTVFAGFVLSNSETGNGAFTITPRIIVQVCNNGMTITKDAERSVHTGQRLDHGIVEWSDTTQEVSLDLARSMTTDAVRTFLSDDYLTRTIARMESKSDFALASVDAVTELAKASRFTAEQTESVLSHFIQGGQMTLGGFVHAATAAAQEVSDGDVAAEMEARATALLV